MSGEIIYNGHTMDEFVPRRSAAYVSQHDLHMGELTVRETVNFSAKCQGIGHRFGKNQENVDFKLIAVPHCIT
jgi:ABC-type multidrug transport system ATPase subunit